MKTLQCCLNGDLMPLDQCRIHISDLGLQRGYGVFDYFRAEKGEIWWKDDYFDRLWHSVEKSSLDFPLSRRDLEEICQMLQAENNLGSSAYKVIVTGGESEDMGTWQGHSMYAVIQRQFTPPPPEHYTEGVHLITYPYKRPEPTVKNLHYYFSTRLHKQLKEQNAADVLYCTDTISETARSNFFGVREGIIHTPDTGILMGITRKQLLTLERFTFKERPIATEELETFDELFITGTTKEVMPITRIDGKKIRNGKPGEVTRSLMSAFKQVRP